MTWPTGITNTLQGRLNRIWENVVRKRLSGQRSRSCSSRRIIKLAQRTGPLDTLAGHDVLVCADAQNLDIGARRLGQMVSWDTLGHKLDWASRSTERHVFLSHPPGLENRMIYFSDRGWVPHARVSRLVQTWRGLEKKSNTDNLFAFFTGVLVSHSQASLVLMCSGDADLVEEVAEAITLLDDAGSTGSPVPKRRQIATLSLPGSTGQRLNATASQYVHHNIELGMDCLRSRCQDSLKRFFPLHSGGGFQ